MQRNANPPPFWTLFLREYLGASEPLARKLWCVYAAYCDATTLWQLHLCSDQPNIQRIFRATKLVTPRTLLAAVEKLAVPGRPRKPELVTLEEHILQHVDATGQWL